MRARSPHADGLRAGLDRGVVKINHEGEDAYEQMPKHAITSSHGASAASASMHQR